MEVVQQPAVVPTKHRRPTATTDNMLMGDMSPEMSKVLSPSSRKAQSQLPMPPRPAFQYNPYDPNLPNPTIIPTCSHHRLSPPKRRPSPNEQYGLSSPPNCISSPDYTSPPSYGALYPEPAQQPPQIQVPTQQSPQNQASYPAATYFSPAVVQYAEHRTRPKSPLRRAARRNRSWVYVGVIIIFAVIFAAAYGITRAFKHEYRSEDKVKYDKDNHHDQGKHDQNDDSFYTIFLRDIPENLPTDLYAPYDPADEVESTVTKEAGILPVDKTHSTLRTVPPVAPSCYPRCQAGEGDVRKHLDECRRGVSFGPCPVVKRRTSQKLRRGHWEDELDEHDKEELKLRTKQCMIEHGFWPKFICKSIAKDDMKIEVEAVEEHMREIGLGQD